MSKKHRPWQSLIVAADNWLWTYGSRLGQIERGPAGFEILLIYTDFSK